MSLNKKIDRAVKFSTIKFIAPNFIYLTDNLSVMTQNSVLNNEGIKEE